NMLLLSACNHYHALLFLSQGKQRSSFISTRHTPLRRSRVVRHCLDLRHLCRLPNQRATVPNIRPMPALTAAVSRGVSSPLIEASIDDMELVSRIIHFYRKPFLQESEAKELLRKVQAKVSSNIIDIKTEQCFNVELEDALGSTKLATLQWLLAETYEPDNLQTGSFLEEEVSRSPYCFLVEVGPRMTFSTAFSTNAVSICKALSLMEVTRLERGREALEEINLKMGLAFDEQDIKYYTHLFRDDIKRNPTTVELFDIAQSNSEHSRHWFFNGKLEIDGETMPSTLFQLDNSSAIKGTLVNHLRPALPGSTSPLSLMMRELGILFTAETHNFPCAVAPYPGAETGAGGRIRDTHATGKGSFVVASTAGYCVGNLQIEESYAPWEDSSFSYPSNLASPLQILIDASDGASDYGNKFGEPLIQGFTRNFGSRLPNGERREWLKPIMFSGAIGQIDHAHISKGDPEIGMLVVKIGGPAYRIGMGGGAASSMVSGQNDAELDFNAVQRGDAEMAQKLYRVIRACAEMGEKNPIISIHDQGAGGNCNVVKEIIYPKGAEIDIRSIVVGDHTLSVLEIWGAEYQEQDALLVKPESRNLLQSLCDRERVSMAVLGEIDGSGKIVLIDSAAVEHAMLSGLPPPPPAVDLELEKITLMDVLKRVLKLPSVCSKRFLTTKVDRCVTGLVAQQQTVGPLQLPLADVAVVAQTYTDLTGGACAIGEQPIKGLLNPEAMARLAVGEALTNLVWAKVTSLADVKASGNWMYAAKIDGEGADMYDAAVAMADCMIQLGIAIDGGKDSLSMAAQCDGELVKAPGNLVISAYVTCPDITLTVTPDLKLVKDGVLLHVDLAKGKRRLGCSALAQAFDQIGNDCPDIEDVPYLKKVFEVVQELLSERLISAGHDISDGGLIVTILEMAFAGNCGVNLNIELKDNDLLQTLFAEELGLVIEVHFDDLDVVKQKLHAAGVSANVIGEVTAAPEIELLVDGEVCLKERTSDLRDLWEETSFQLEELQRLKSCVKLEKEGLKSRTSPSWHLSFTPKFTDKKLLSASSKPKVAIIREEGSNSDREMSAAFHAAGFEPWDITMSDLLNKKASLTEFRGIAFVGGFSYADVLDSAKGWAASIRHIQPWGVQWVSAHGSSWLGTRTRYWRLAWCRWRHVPAKVHSQ
uniref:phosphoribosylformylglycinamidine synthase n=1 Tax=Aegilops tauschii subsp. strangulata TaxID=200361 RepID=A0A452ZPH3_AEGTS